MGREKLLAAGRVSGRSAALSGRLEQPDYPRFEPALIAGETAVVPARPYWTTVNFAAGARF